MFKESILHAWQRTKRSLGWPSILWTLLAIPIAGFALHYKFSGYNEMMGEFHIFMIYGLAATGLVFASLFLFNLVCAPYQIERDKRVYLENRILEISGKNDGQSLSEFWESRDYFTAKEVACLRAGVPISNGELFGVADGYYYDLCKKITDGSIVPINMNRDLRLILQMRRVEQQYNLPLSGPSPSEISLANYEISKEDAIRFGVKEDDL